MFRKTIGLFVCFSILSASEALASLVTNGGFETGTFSGWTETTYSDWTFSTTATPTWFWTVQNPAHSGTYAAELNGDPGVNAISQNLATVAGMSYTLDFWVTHPYSNSGPSQFEAFWNGAPVLDLTSPMANLGWTEYTFTEQATSASTPLMFAGQDLPTYIYVDDISVVPANAPVVPEPATVIVWSILAVAGLAAAWRGMKLGTTC